MRKTISVNCTYCGKPKDIEPSQICKSGHVFCNRDCMNKWKSVNLVGPKHNRYVEPIKTICAYCKSFISLQPNEAISSNKHFCNADCYTKWKNIHYIGEDSPNWQGGKKYTVYCELCGKPKNLHKSELNKGNKYFCNEQNRQTWMKLYFRGPIHPHWRGGLGMKYGPNWEDKKALIRARDHDTCQICKTPHKAGEKEFDVHHIIPFRMFNNDHELANKLDNLILLCRSCHVIEDSKLR